ncbi:precorrin-2 C(20)-methyltransferase [Lentibacter algarum]|uniref:precorrin-2 C(20)-methyltransferase n=1 Tax=Lentibacter algarum TaxID=576131 RepID=UPI001C06FC0A|nr:precorrin-2 C(20)-methyltransferase [Lentibacter algarum]MBU2981654.1 precorrin-2 C(20)-methyltransferase [Lentibacter algarum]
MKGGTIFGVGLGPGNPELMSVKADRLVRGAAHIAYFRKAGRKGQSRQIVEGMLAANVTEFAMEYPVTTEIPLSDPRYNEVLSEFYESCTAHLRALAETGEDVIVLCEGDPFFYGSFMHLYTRLQGNTQVEVIPAITGMSAAYTTTGQPITWGDDIMSVLMATLPEDALTEAMQAADAIIVMKIGKNIDKLRRALKAAGKFEAAWIVEYASMPNQKMRLLSDTGSEPVPYFSIVVVHGNGRRP